MGAEDEASCLQKTIRGLFIAFNILFCIIGVILIGVGSYVVAKGNSSDYNQLLGFLGEKDTSISKDNLTPDQKLVNDAYVVKGSLLAIGGFIIFMGLVIFLISTCGWLGACKQNTCLLFTFTVMMIVIVVLELIVGIVAVVAVKKVKGPNGGMAPALAKEVLNQGDKAYHTEGDTMLSIKEAWELSQAQGNCCGINGPGDWRNKTLAPLFAEQENKHPPACYPDSDETKPVYEEGCWESITDVLSSMSGALGGTVLFFCFVEIFGIVISCYLVINMRKGNAYMQH